MARGPRDLTVDIAPVDDACFHPIRAGEARKSLQSIVNYLEDFLEPYVVAVEQIQQQQMAQAEGGQQIRFQWRGKQVFLHRTCETAPDKTFAVRYLSLAAGLLDKIETHQHSDLERAVADALSLGYGIRWLGKMLDGTSLRFYRSKFTKQKGAAVTNEAHKELHSEYEREVSKLLAQGYKYTTASDEVAARFGVTGRTVRKYAPNPSAAKRRR